MGLKFKSLLLLLLVAPTAFADFNDDCDRLLHPYIQVAQYHGERESLEQPRWINSITDGTKLINFLSRKIEEASVEVDYMLVDGTSPAEVQDSLSDLRAAHMLLSTLVSLPHDQQSKDWQIVRSTLSAMSIRLRLASTNLSGHITSDGLTGYLTVAREILRTERLQLSEQLVVLREHLELLDRMVSEAMRLSLDVQFKQQSERALAYGTLVALHVLTQPERVEQARQFFSFNILSNLRFSNLINAPDEEHVFDHFAYYFKAKDSLVLSKKKKLTYGQSLESMREAVVGRMMMVQQSVGLDEQMAFDIQPHFTGRVISVALRHDEQAIELKLVENDRTLRTLTVKVDQGFHFYPVHSKSEFNPTKSYVRQWVQLSLHLRSQHHWRQSTKMVVQILEQRPLYLKVRTADGDQVTLPLFESSNAWLELNPL